MSTILWVDFNKRKNKEYKLICTKCHRVVVDTIDELVEANVRQYCTECYRKASLWDFCGGTFDANDMVGSAKIPHLQYFEPFIRNHMSNKNADELGLLFYIIGDNKRKEILKLKVNFRHRVLFLSNFGDVILSTMIGKQSDGMTVLEKRQAGEESEADTLSRSIFEGYADKDRKWLPIFKTP